MKHGLEMKKKKKMQNDRVGKYKGTRGQVQGTWHTGKSSFFPKKKTTTREKD